jgi:putative GTP pyrophosphokinase
MSASKTQIDRLGERLKSGTVTDEDLTLLDEFRRSHGEAYRIIIQILRECLNVNPSGRPAKSTTSIIDKLQRENLRLTQMQDIAGCRVIVSDCEKQSSIAETLMDQLGKSNISGTLIDRRKTPSNGYRAVHLVAFTLDRHVEIQIRTDLQHRWSELSEVLADRIDPKLKYGGGPTEMQNVLLKASRLVANHESEEASLQTYLQSFSDDHEMASNMREIAERKAPVEKNHLALLNGFDKIISDVILEVDQQ